MKTFTSQSISKENHESSLYEFRYKAFLIFLSGYVFLSGFVFVEPSPAEIWFLLSLPIFFQRFSTNWDVIFSFFLLLLPLSTSTFTGLILKLFNFKFFIIDIYLFVFFFVVVSYIQNLQNQNINTQDLIEKIMKYWAWAGGINILFGLYAFVSGRESIFGINILNYGIRLQGFFEDPNVLGPFLVPVAVYFLIRWLDSKKSYLSFLYFLFFSFGTLLTFSRAAWLNYALAVMIVLAMRIIKKKNVSRVIWFLVLAFILFSIFLTISGRIYFLDFNLKDFLKSRMGLQSYDTGRFEAQRKFGDIMFSQGILSTLFGVGPGNYEFFAGMAPHSLFVRYIGERGFFGISLFVIFIIVIWQKTIHSQNKDFLIPVLLGLFVNSLFIDSLHWRHLWLLFILTYL